jgi:hypothetical protein
MHAMQTFARVLFVEDDIQKQAFWSALGYAEVGAMCTTLYSSLSVVLIDSRNGLIHTMVALRCRLWRTVHAPGLPP